MLGIPAMRTAGAALVGNLASDASVLIRKTLKHWNKERTTDALCKIHCLSLKVVVRLAARRGVLSLLELSSLLL